MTLRRPAVGLHARPCSSSSRDSRPTEAIATWQPTAHRWTCAGRPWRAWRRPHTWNAAASSRAPSCRGRLLRFVQLDSEWCLDQAAADGWVRWGAAVPTCAHAHRPGRVWPRRRSAGSLGRECRRRRLMAAEGRRIGDRGYSGPTGDGAMRAATGVVSRTVPETSWNPPRGAARSSCRARGEVDGARR
jgi:hypothetical protein